MKRYAIPLLIAAAAIALAALFLLGSTASGKPKPSASPAATLRANPAGLPGLLIGPAPWPKNTAQLAARLTALGLPQITTQPIYLHIHQHLDMFVNGQPVAIPGQIGITGPGSFNATMTTENTSGVIHVESPTVQNFYLGQVFDTWGVRLTSSCLGGYCTDSANELSMYVNGAKYAGNLRALKLADHQEIVLVYGPPASLPSPIPASYPFPSDL